MAFLICLYCIDRQPFYIVFVMCLYYLVFRVVYYDYKQPRHKNALSKTLIFNKKDRETKKIGGYLVTS